MSECLLNILKARGLDGLNRNEPFWKLRLTDDEYEGLKRTLRSHVGELSLYGCEAALCYAEWWRRDYNGGHPNKIDVAKGIGLSENYSDDLYKAAREALREMGFPVIHANRNKQPFRTLLSQGGLPVNYIITNDNLGNFTRFLKGLVKELYLINHDWSNDDHSFVHSLDCVHYLGRTFRNENIYIVAMQIARAIIMNEPEHLPYDDRDGEGLAQLTRSLQDEYGRVREARRTRSLSLSWELHTSEDRSRGDLYVNMDVVKEISSDYLEEYGFNPDTCYTFDVFVAGTFVSTYRRKEYCSDAAGEKPRAVYARITMDKNANILWRGEPVVEVKLCCDDDKRIFLTVAGCYPPNFEYPQMFQMLNDNVYGRCNTADSDKNIAIFTPQWECESAQPMMICGRDLQCTVFSSTLSLRHKETKEEVTLTNTYTPYSIEFRNNYVSWIEEANFKVLTNTPVIDVYDGDKNKVLNNIKKQYRPRSRNGNRKWEQLTSRTQLPFGVVDIRVTFPDEHSIIETFYYIGNMTFESSKEKAHSTQLACFCDESLVPEIEKNDNLDIENIGSREWKISRQPKSTVCPTCAFRIYNEGNPVLRLSVAIPFKGMIITKSDGKVIPTGDVVSLSNLYNYRIISHGKGSVTVTYTSDISNDNQEYKRLKSEVVNGIVPLSDYRELIMRMFNLYGAKSSDRKSAVVMELPNIKIYIRKFVRDTTIDNGRILITNDGRNIKTKKYEADLYAFPVGEGVEVQEIKFEEDGDNGFVAPEDFKYNEVVVFSGPEASRRIVPKFYNLQMGDYSDEERNILAKANIIKWVENLQNASLLQNEYWEEACKAFGLCSRKQLPFSTHNSLKAIAGDPMLTVKFIIAMWQNGFNDLLTNEIDRFEQEMAIALHWISLNTWRGTILEYYDALSEMSPAQGNMFFNDFSAFVQDLFESTLFSNHTNQIGMVLITYIKGGNVECGQRFGKADITNFCSKIIGGDDLPVEEFQLQGKYYPPQDNMLPHYRTMIESAMCAAENICGVQGCTDLFSRKNKTKARTVNFYRRYFKELFSEIFIRTVKYIVNP